MLKPGRFGKYSRNTCKVLSCGAGEGWISERFVKNEKVLRRVNEKGNALHKIQRRKANWIAHILRRNCLLKHVIEEIMEGIMTGRRGRRRKQLLNDLKEKTGYWKLKRERTSSYCVENSLWKRLWTRRKAD